MEKSNLELFKQAISEGLSNRFDSVVNSYTDEIECSENHKLAMHTIIYGKIEKKRFWTPKTKRIIAILVAIALLLPSCGIIFRNQIREILKEYFVSLSYESNDETHDMIKEVYTLGYLPEGYTLEKEKIEPLRITYKFTDELGNILYFEQRSITSTDFTVDSESGYSHIEDIAEYEVYYRFTGENHIYVFSNEKYSINIKSSTKLSNEDIILMLNGLRTK